MLKHIKKDLSQFLTKKDKQNYISKIKDKKKNLKYSTVLNFSENYKIKIIYQNIDWITCKISSINPAVQDIKDSLVSNYDHSIDIDQMKNKPINTYLHKTLYPETFETNFYFLHLGEKFNGQYSIYGIYDNQKNKIGSLSYLNKNKQKRNNNVYTSLELTGIFWKSYQKHFDDFLKFFGIPRNENDVLKRLDYCVDIQGIEVFQFLEFLKPHFKITKNVNALTATDKKLLLEDFDSDIKYGKQETFKNFLGTLNDFKIYDKILDLLQPKLLKRKINGKNPYQEYIDSDLPIVRLELKKKASSFTKIKDHSIDSMFRDIQDLFFDYLLRYFTIDLSIYVGENIGLNGKKIHLAKEEKQKNLFHAIMMAKSYLQTIEDISGKEEVFKLLFQQYPDINKVNPLDFINRIDVSDYFLGYTDTL